MHYYDIQPVARTAKNLGYATYESEEKLTRGNVVRIPYGSRTTAGVVLKKTAKPKFNTKPITGLISEQELSSDILELALKLISYYPISSASAYSLLVPNGAHKNRRGEITHISGESNYTNQPVLTKNQHRVITQLNDKTGYSSWLLHGVTGSGKTRVYFEQIKHYLDLKRDSILLVPEIALSEQLISQAREFFDCPIYQLNSTMTESQSHKVWQAVLEEKNNCLVIGPRSALFAPVKNLGLIVIDECHDQSYKQDQDPHYNALHVAALRAESAQAKLIMGSATPNITERWLANENHINYLSLPETVHNQADHNRLIIDTRKRDNFTRSKIISNQLLDSIHDALTNSKQSLLYVNRRGHSPIVRCSECDWRAVCDICHLPLVYHAANGKLQCHVCNTKQPLLTTCPECNSAAVRYQGVGTQKLEAEIIKLFPNAKVARLDRDSDSKKATGSILKRMYSGDLDILLGTQMITKGFDFKQLAVVGIINADSMLYLPDYRSGERAFQVIYQAIGRNDRLGEGGTTVIQTSNPNHHAIQHAAHHDYDSFFKLELNDRKLSSFPPYSYLLQITARRKSAASASGALTEVSKHINSSFRILGPAPALHEIHGQNYVWHLIVGSKSRKDLYRLASSLRDKNITLNLDPLDLL